MPQPEEAPDGNAQMLAVCLMIEKQELTAEGKR